MVECTCGRKLEYCCETAILESWNRKHPDRKEHIAKHKVYIVHKMAYGFSKDCQLDKLREQNYNCACCGERKEGLVIDKKKANSNGRLSFICRVCLASIRRVQKYMEV